MTYRHQIAAIFVCAGLTAAPSTQAGENGLVRVATGVGSWIAAQGNAALRDIQEDLRQDLGERLRPLLPAREESEDDGAAPRRAAGA